MIEGGVSPLQFEKHNFPTGLSKIQKLKKKYKATIAQLLRKTNGAQFSINIRLIPPKDINSRA
jgi:hypothetical protein